MQKGTSLERGSPFQQMVREQLAFYAKKWDFPGGSDGKASACLQCGRQVSIPGSGGSPGEGNGNPFQYSCQENPMDSGSW